MKNIALVGFMGTGKSTIASALAKSLNAEYIDLDDLIEQKEGMKIVDIFAKKGENYFRKLEKEAVFDVSLQNNKVIACGGGVVINQENIDNLKKSGIIICLEASPEVILKRTQSYGHRPLLNVEDPKNKIRELLEQRKEYYQKADYSIDTSNLNTQEVTEKIRSLLKEKEII